MNQYNIVSNGIILDTYEDLAISINKELKDVLDITKRAEDWSNPITLPGTKINNKFFKQIFDVNIETINFNPNKRIKAQITIGDNTIFNGYLQLDKIFVNHDMIEYDVIIFGVLSNLVNGLGDKLLSDLDLSEYDHTRDRETIVNSWDYTIQKNGNTVNVGGPGEGYVYPYIVYGGSTDILNTAYIYDLFPAVYSKTLVDRMFYELGYKVKSKFLNSDYFKMIIEPFVNDKLQLSQEDFLKRNVIVGIDAALDYAFAGPWLSRGSSWFTSSTLPFTRETGLVNDEGNELEFRDSENQFTGGYYTNQKSGWYNISWVGNAFMEFRNTYQGGGDINYDEGTGEFEFQWRLFKNGQILDDSGVRLIAPGAGDLIIDVNNPIDMILRADNVFLAPGDVVRVVYEYRYPSQVKWIGIWDNYIDMRLLFKRVLGTKFSKFTVIPTSNDSKGNEELTLSKCVTTNRKCSDLLSDIVQSFNLIITEDSSEDSTLLIEPDKEFFASKQKLLDWEGDKKLDYNNDYEITPMSELDAKEYYFGHQSDDDLYNKEYQNETKRVYGDFSINVDNDFSDKTSKTVLNIAGTPDAQKGINGRVAPFFVEKDDEKYKQKKVKPRMLFYGGLIDNPNGTPFNLKDHIKSTIFTVSTQYPYCGMWDHPTDAKYDLAFGMTDKIYFDTNQIPNNNLYNMFYKNSIEEIIDPNSRMLKGKFKLTPKDIANFDFRDVVFLLGSYWRVVKINNYNPVAADKLTDVTLLKLNNLDVLTPDSVSVPISNDSCPTDVVLRKVGKRYQYVSQSGIPISQDCCKSKGGVYMEGSCYIGEAPIGGVATNGTPGPIKPDTKPVRVPVRIPEGPSVFNQDTNTTNSNGVKNTGRGNFVPSGVDQTVILNGTDISVKAGVKNVFAVGTGIYVDQSDVIQIGNTTIDGSGNFNVMYNLLQCGRDEVRFLFPTTFNYNLFKGARDALRDPGFMSGINYVDGGRDSI